MPRTGLNVVVAITAKQTVIAITSIEVVIAVAAGQRVISGQPGCIIIADCPDPVVGELIPDIIYARDRSGWSVIVEYLKGRRGVVGGQRIVWIGLYDDPEDFILLVPGVSKDVNRNRFRRLSRQESDRYVQQTRIIPIVVEPLVHRRADIDRFDGKPRPIAGYREGQSGIAFGDRGVGRRDLPCRITAFCLNCKGCSGIALGLGVGESNIHDLATCHSVQPRNRRPNSSCVLDLKESTRWKPTARIYRPKTNS